MQKSDFEGVFPAITTKMTSSQDVDLAGVRSDVRFQIDAGVEGIILCGSLGEASSLTAEEKVDIARVALDEAAGRVPVLMTIAEDSTRAGVRLVQAVEKLGINGLMVLPAMRYLSDARETSTHFRAIADASALPIILYNNPVAYTIDLSVEDLAALADEPKFVAVKESSADTRRINAIIEVLKDRYTLLTGVDNLALESLILGCKGWIAGLVCAFPKETTAIHRLVMANRIPEALEIYRWFLPLLAFDIGPKFVQKIKLVEHLVRGTSPVVRAPRLTLTADDEREVRAVLERSLKNRPDIAKYGSVALSRNWRDASGS